MSNRCDYGIIIADFKTPDWDAVEMAVAIDVIDPGQKVFVMSPDLFADVKEYLLNLGVLGYGERPKSKEELLLLVRSCLSRDITKPSFYINLLQVSPCDMFITSVLSFGWFFTVSK